MSGNAPPSRGEKLGSSVGIDKLQVCHVSSTAQRSSIRLTLGVSTISEIKLLHVGAFESPRAEALDNENQGDGRVAEVDRVKGEVPRLEAVGKRDKQQVSERQHESESVGSNVHLVENGRLSFSANPCPSTTRATHLLPERVKGVPSFK